MMFDPRTAMIDKDRPLWLRDPKAAARAEFSKEPRGPKEIDRKILTILNSRVLWRLREWLRG